MPLSTRIRTLLFGHLAERQVAWDSGPRPRIVHDREARKPAACDDSKELVGWWDLKIEGVPIRVYAQVDCPTVWEWATMNDAPRRLWERDQDTQIIDTLSYAIETGHRQWEGGRPPVVGDWFIPPGYG